MYLDRKFSSFSSSFFKPIVATSLLFLLPSLGMGDDNVYTVDGDGPTIKVTSTETAPTYLSWEKACTNAACTTTGAASWTETSSTWTGTYNSNRIANLILSFDNTNTTTKDKSFVYLSTSTSNSTTTASATVYGAGTSATAITANFENKNLGTSTDTINLDLKFGSSSGTKKITVENLNTLYGTLYIRSTATSGSTADIYNYDITLNTLNGILAVQGSNYFMQGSVTIKSALVGSIYVSGNSTATINSKNSSTAGLTVNFVNGATMTGDILDRANGFAGIRKDIYFKDGSGTVLTGSIVSFGTGSSDSDYLNTNAGNRVYFTQGDMKGYIIASTGQKSSSDKGGDTSRKGLNVVIFGDTASQTTHTLTGGILASDIKSSSVSDTSAQQATNVVVLADNTTLNIKANSSDTAINEFANGELKGGDDGSNASSTFSVTSGSIIARNFGVNEIRIYSNSTLNLNGGNGSIKSVVNDVGSVSNGSALNKINFLSEGGVIQGSILADNSKNTGSTNKASILIYVANNASGTITGNLETKSNSSTSGRLTVTLGSSNTTSVTGGDVKNATTDSTSTNTSTLTLQGSSNTITGLTASAPTTSGTTNTANLVLDSSNSSSESGQTTTISGTVSNNASALNFI